MSKIPDPTSRLGLVIIAGGAGSRLGDPHKALSRLVDGRSVVQRLVDEARTLIVDPVVIASNDPAPYLATPWQVVPDRLAHAGPLAGIAAGLHQIRTLGFDAALILAGDLPAVSGTELARLVAAWRVHGGIAEAWVSGNPPRRQPLCAVVPTALESPITVALETGERSVQRLWNQFAAQPVWFDDPAPFANLNTPNDLETLGIRRRVLSH